MKKALLTLLFSLAISTLWAQTFKNNTKYFFMGHMGFINKNYWFTETLEYDSAASGFEHYTVIRQTSTGTGTYYRIRVKDKIVYGQGGDTLYDFGLVKNDNYRYYSVVNFRVDSTGALNVAGNSTKLMFMKSLTGSAEDMIWNEELGDLKFGLMHKQKNHIDNYERVKAICRNDTVLYWNEDEFNTGYFTNPPDTTCDFASLSLLVSVKKLAGSPQFKVYPNPANDQLNIHFIKGGAHNIQLQNSLGQVCAVYEVMGSGEHFIDVSEFLPGIYFIKADDDIPVKNVINR